QAPAADLMHLERTHTLLRHPPQSRRLRPVAAQPDLKKSVAPTRAGLDQPAHRQTVPDEAAPLHVAGVRVRVEVDHRHTAPPFRAGHAGDVRPGDRVVASEHKWYGTRFRRGLDRALERVARSLALDPRHLDVPGVDDP